MAGRLQRKKRAPTAPPQTDHAPGIWADAWGRAGIRSAQTLLILTLVTVTAYALITLRIVVIPVLLALILAAAIGPLVNALKRKRVPGALAAWIALLAILLVFGGIVTGVVFAVRSEWSSLVESASEGIQELRQLLIGSFSVDGEQLEQFRQQVVDFLTSGQFVTGALSQAVAVAEIVTGVLLMVVILFFFLKDGDAIWEFFVGRLGGSRKQRVREAGQSAVEVLGGYVRGTAVIAAFDGVVIGVALFILQVPLALPLAVIVFVGAFIPIVGATVTGALAALVALVANGPVNALIVVAVVVAINQIEGDLLAPNVLGKSLDLHPLVILVALSAGTILGGVIGAILAVPLAAVAWAVYRTWNGEMRPQQRSRQPA